MGEGIRDYSIALLVPSRKRASNIKRLIDSISKTAKVRDNITIYFYIDDDDFENEFQSDDEEQFKDNYFNHDDQPQISEEDLENHVCDHFDGKCKCPDKCKSKKVLAKKKFDEY